MRAKTFTLIALAVAASAMTYFAVTTVAQGRGSGPVIYVTGQGLVYDSIVMTALPHKGPFQLLEMTGPTRRVGGGRDKHQEYVGGRWWVDANGNGMQDDEDAYFICPLLPPGRPLS